MQRVDPIAHCLGVALGLAALSSAAAADDPKNSACLLDSIDSQSTSGSSINENPAAMPLKLLRSGQESSAALDPVCTGDRLATLGLSLIPGQTLSLILITRPGVALPLQVTELAGEPEGGQNGTWEVSLRALESSTNFQPAQLIELVVTAGENNRRGQQQSFRLFATASAKAGPQDLWLDLNLESLDGERMFRDNFRVDPSVGQFSQRTRRSDAIDDRSGQGAASASL